LAIAPTLSPNLTAAIEKNGPLTLVTPQSKPFTENPFAERLCRAVTGQQLSARAAGTIWNRVLASLPENETMIDYFAQVEPDVLKSCGLSRAKIKTVKAIAQADQQRQLDPTELGQLGHTERTQRLTAIWGIGQWTADMMGIFYFGDENIWPEGDLAARKTLERLTSKRRKTLRTAARFAPYQSYLALHMWKYVDASPDK